MTATDTAILSGSLSTQNGNGGGSINFALRRVTSAKGWGEVRVLTVRIMLSIAVLFLNTDALKASPQKDLRWPHHRIKKQMSNLHELTVPKRKFRLVPEKESSVCWTAPGWDRAARFPLRRRLQKSNLEKLHICSLPAETCRLFPSPPGSEGRRCVRAPLH